MYSYRTYISQICTERHKKSIKNIQNNNFLLKNKLLGAGMLFRSSMATKIVRPVTFQLHDLECEFLFLNDVEIQNILEFKNNFGKYHPFFPKNPFKNCLEYPLHCTLLGYAAPLEHCLQRHNEIFIIRVLYWFQSLSDQ